MNLLENHTKRGLDNILPVYLSFAKVCARFRTNRETFVNHIRPDYLYIEEQNSFDLVKTFNETSNCHLHQHGATFVKVI